jgi:hypothetical protein
MSQPYVNDLLERVDELMNALRWEIELEELDCNQPLALSVISAKHGSERACTNLMENPKWSERVWSRRADRFRVQ